MGIQELSSSWHEGKPAAWEGSADVCGTALSSGSGEKVGTILFEKVQQTFAVLHPSLLAR